jgi:hypothetical protein
MVRTKGIVHTIKDGVVIENAKLMEEVARMVARSRQGATAANAEWSPFLVPGSRTSTDRPGGSGR